MTDAEVWLCSFIAFLLSSLLFNFRLCSLDKFSGQVLFNPRLQSFVRSSLLSEDHHFVDETCQPTFNDLFAVAESPEFFNEFARNVTKVSRTICQSKCVPT